MDERLSAISEKDQAWATIAPHRKALISVYEKTLSGQALDHAEHHLLLGAIALMLGELLYRELEASSLTAQGR